MAGIFTSPCTWLPSGIVTISKGQAAKRGGIWMPKSCKKEPTYLDQLTATTDEATAYSKTRSQPMIQAMNSPMVA